MALHQSARFGILDTKSQIVVRALLDHRKASKDELQDQTNAIAQMLNHTEVVVTSQHNKTQRVIIEIGRAHV